MEKKYKLIGVSSYAERFLSCEDLDSLKEMIGCEIIESRKSWIDGRTLFLMPNGEEAHIDFLELEQIQPELNFKDVS